MTFGCKTRVCLQYGFPADSSLVRSSSLFNRIDAILSKSTISCSDTLLKGSSMCFGHLAWSLDPGSRGSGLLHYLTLFSICDIPYGPVESGPMTWLWTEISESR